MSAGSPVTSAAPGAATEPQKLVGTMGVAELVFTVLAFAAPVAVVAGLIPFVIVFNGIGTPATYAVTTVLLLTFAVGYTTMSRQLSNPGAFYAYVTAGLGRTVGLGSAFMATCAYFVLGINGYTFFGIACEQLLQSFDLPAGSWYWYSLACWAACALLGYVNIGVSAKVLSVAMILEVTVVIVYDVAVAFGSTPGERTMAPFEWSSFTSGSLGVAMLFAAVSFLGFEATAVFREEVKDPDRNVPRATYLAVALIGALYVLTSLMIVFAYGTDGVTDVATDNPTGMFGDSMTQYVSHTATDIVSVLLVTSIFASMISQQNILARYIFALSGDGAISPKLNRVHPVHKSPHRASMAATAAVFLGVAPFVVAGVDPVTLFSRATGVGGYLVLALMFMTSVAVLAYFRSVRRESVADHWRMTVAPTIAALGLGVIVFLASRYFSVLVAGSTTVAVLLLVVVWSVFLVGVITALYFRRSRPEIFRRIGMQRVG